MQGSIQWDKRSGKPYVKLYWDGKQVAINTDKRTNSTILSHGHAVKVLGIIQGEIDDGTFDREEWKKKKGVFPGGKPKPTVKRWADKWLKDRKKLCDAGKIVPRTLKDDKGAVKKIVKYFGHKSLDQVTKKDIEKFHDQLNFSKSARYNIVSTFRKMLNDAAEEGLINKVPDFPKLSKKSRASKHAMEPDVQNRVIAEISPADKPIFQVLRQYGLRPGEARAIHKSSIRDGELHIEWSFSENLLRNTTKTGEARSYSLTSFALEVIDQIPANESEFLFVRGDGKPYTSKNLNKIWRQACKDAGISHFKLYNAMRHSLARNLLEAGHGFDMVAEVLGHASIEMARRHYADMPMNRVRDALSSLSDSPDWVGR